MTGPRRRPLEVVLRNDKPVAVIIDIEDYRELLERLEDSEDLQELEAMRSAALHFAKLEDFLDAEDAREALREYEEGKTIPWEQAKKDLGL